MNVHELPLIAFTILAQMCVGAFVVLGIIQLIGPRLFTNDVADEHAHGHPSPRPGDSTRPQGSQACDHDATEDARVNAQPGPIARLLERFHLNRAPAETAVDRLTDPVLFAIGPVLVLGLLGSMLHLGNPFNALNTFRHLGTSWLSREILGGCAFAGLGFVFAVSQWFKWGSSALRRILALATAVVGLILVWVMAMVYASLPTVPAWHLWTTPATFYVTTFLLGCLAVGAALMTVTMWERKHGVDISAGTGSALTRILQAIAVAAAGLAIVQVVLLVLQLTTMAADPSMPRESSQALFTTFFLMRLILLIVGACLLGFFLFQAVSQRRSWTMIASVATLAFVIVLASEVMGRSLFYDTMVRIGM